MLPNRRPSLLSGSRFPREAVAYWRMDEAAGAAIAKIGPNLTDNNTVTSAAGKVYSLARSFAAASSESLSVTTSSQITMGDIPFSVSLWVNPTAYVSFDTLFSKGTTGQNKNQEYYSFVDTSSGNILYFVVGNGTTSGSVSIAALSTAAWSLVNCWHDADADTVNIQVNNGTPVSAAFAGGSLQSAGGLLIGAVTSEAPALFWNGAIGPVGIWKRVLTAAERTLLWNSGNGFYY